MEIDKPVVAFFLTIILSQLVLAFLKLKEIIDWGWEWVLFPIWAPYALFVLCGTCIVIYLTFFNLKERISKKRHGRQLSERKES